MTIIQAYKVLLQTSYANSVTQVNEAYELLYKKSGKRHSGNNMPFVCDKTFPESINMQIF